MATSFRGSEPTQPTETALDRRQFLRGGMAGAATAAFTALAARSRLARADRGCASDYGPLSPTRDRATGLFLLALPAGFEYWSYGWTGQTMSDGRPTPTAHDGMAVVGRQGRLVTLVRNHELSAGQGSPCVVAGGIYNPAEFGGTTNLTFDLSARRFVSSWTTMGGTIRNCAGGPTPWSSWITCEETFHRWGSRADGFNHGYIFEIPASGHGTGVPIRAAGRFSHEAVAIDPRTGILYETEDATPSGFFRYIQEGCAPGRPSRSSRRGLRDGGRLEAMVVDGVSRKNLMGELADGDTFSVTWQPVTDPEGKLGTAYQSAPDAAMFARGEGCFHDGGLIYFISTSGGGARLGQVWVYDPDQETVTMLFESRSADVLSGPDNMAVSPQGGILLCEDGGHDPQRLVGLAPNGATFEFAQNRIELAPGDIDVIDSVFPGAKANFWHDPVGSYTDVEWAGATFHGRWLFVNIQTPGVTFAITGPWQRGAL